MNSNARAADCPDAVVDWIAWYSEGLLPEAARGRIEAHAAECTRCRQELAMLRGGEVPEDVTVPDASAVFGKVLARIEADALERSAMSVPARPAAASPRAPRSLRSARGWRRRAMAMAAGVALVAGALGAWVTTRLSEPVYLTAAATPEARAEIDAVFQRDAPFGRIEAGLRAIGGTIVAGPSAGGRVRVSLPQGADPAAAATRLREQLGDAALLVEPALP